MILRNMDPSIDPCTNFYNFTCGGYFKKNLTRSTYGDYLDKLDIVSDFLESNKTVQHFDISMARNIYKSCKKLGKFVFFKIKYFISNVDVQSLMFRFFKKISVPDDERKREIIEDYARKVGVKIEKYNSSTQTKYYDWNEHFNWIDGIHKLRKEGLNFRFLLGIYVTPRSSTDKRNILEVH